MFTLALHCFVLNKIEYKLLVGNVTNIIKEILKK